MSSEEIKKAMHTAIQKIKSETSILTYIINMNYYFLFCYFHFLFVSSFLVNSIIFAFEDTNYLVKKNSFIIVQEKGIKLYNNFIPYENITVFSYKAGIVNLNILGTIDKNLKITLGTDVLKVSLNCLNGEKLVKLIKKNMYYHIRYNKINTEVISYYKNT